MKAIDMEKILIIVLSLSFLIACERNVDIDIPTKAPKLVVSAWMEKGKDIEVTISKSRHILAPGYNGSMENYIVTDATAVLYENGTPIANLVYSPTDYKYHANSSVHVRDGYTYSIKVNAPGFTEAESATGVPTQSSIAETKIVHDARVNSYGEHLDEVTIKFNDPAGEKNLYLVKVYPAGYGNYENHPVWCVSTTDKDLEAIGEDADPLSTDNCFDGGNLLLRDDNFNGSQKQLRLYVSNYEMQEHFDPNTNATNRPYIKVYRITEDHFKYLKSYGVYYMSTDNPFAEPVNVYTNVKNGFGNFAAYTAAVDTLR